MHTDEIREMVDVALTAYNQCDWDNVLAQFSNDVELELGSSGVVHGPAAAVMAIGYYTHHFEAKFTHWTTFIEGDNVAVDATIRIKYVVSEAGAVEARGQVAIVPIALFGSAKDGKISRARIMFSFSFWRNIIT